MGWWASFGAETLSASNLTDERSHTFILGDVERAVHGRTLHVVLHLYEPEASKVSVCH